MAKKVSTVNDAIRLYEKALTEDALIGLGITEAKVKFVYPFKNKGDEEDTELSDTSKSGDPTKEWSRTKPKKKTSKVSVNISEAKSTKSAESQDQELEGDNDLEKGNQLASELEEIAQRLSEIAQDEMGKVDWSKVDKQRFTNAVIGILDAGTSISTRYENDNANS